jgi:hypothetical protein
MKSKVNNTEWNCNFYVYLENSQSSFLAIFSGRFVVESSPITTDTRDVKLQLAGDTFLDVDDPQGLASSGFDSGDLYSKWLVIIISVGW